MTDRLLPMPLDVWLKERVDNARRIAASKTGADRDGWLEDLAYWEAALEVVSLTAGLRPDLAAQEIAELKGSRRQLFEALRAMCEWWAYAQAKPPGAQPDADDEKNVEQLATDALNALHRVDPSYLKRTPRASH